MSLAEIIFLPFLVSFFVSIIILFIGWVLHKSFGWHWDDIFGMFAVLILSSPLIWLGGALILTIFGWEGLR